MKLPRDIAGRLLAETLCRHWRYHKVHQTGSHIILETEDPSPFPITTHFELVRSMEFYEQYRLTRA